jgi:4-amino-4-deoxy-L-arabinose transferase-like glycosyltransferase
LIVMTWRKAPVEAFLASSFFALSWEVAYHSRWIATDGILMQFGTLTILLCLASYHSKRKQGIASLAAVAAGLGFGTKYPGGLLIVPVIATIILDTIAFHSPNALALVDSAGPLTSFFRAIQTQRELLRLHCAFVPLA